MRDSAARAHALHVARLDDRSIAHAILVRKRPLQHITDNFHVLVTVRAEALPWLNAILVEHPQTSEVHVFGVEIAGEGKGMEAVQPAVVSVATLIGSTNIQHAVRLSKKLSLFTITECLYPIMGCFRANESE